MRFVVTGPPGAGKTTVLEHLAARGFHVVPESARALIAERRARGLSPRPAPTEFVETLLQRDRAAYDACPSGPALFDRGLPDTLGSALGIGLLDARGVREELSRRPFAQRVLLFTPWAEIYRTDAERDQTFTEAVLVHERIRRYYGDLGFELVEVPRTDVAARADFVARQLAGYVEAQDHGASSGKATGRPAQEA